MRLVRSYERKRIRKNPIFLRASHNSLLVQMGKNRFSRHALINWRNSNLSTDSESARNFTMRLFYGIFRNSKIKKVAPFAPQKAP